MTPNDELVDSWIQDFRNAHDSDQGNAARQSFEDYWAWVKVFLVTGAAGQRGWLDQGEVVLRGVRDAAGAEELRGRLRTIGTTIAAEWAKDSRARRIHSTILQGSPNLMDLGRRLQRAAGEDSGNGGAIRLALDAIERDVSAALGE
jgi:hypothetical protein